MTDYRSAIAGSYPQQFPLKIACILDEGNITVTDRAYDRGGTYEAAYAFASELREGDYVALSNNTVNTFVAAGGIPVVERAVTAEKLVIGKLVSAPKHLAALPANDAAADSWSERIASHYYRIAQLEVHAGITKIEKATFMCNGSNACAIGVATTLNFNITGAYSDHILSFEGASANGVGAIPFHYAPATTDGDEYTILVGINGLMYSVTGEE